MTLISRRTALAGLVAASSSARIPAVRAQASFPNGRGAIKLVIPFAAGGASDVVARLLGDSLTRRWGVPAVLEHVPGGSTTTGVARVARGPADGSQILILNLPFITTQFMLPQLPYDPQRDIVPLAQLTRQPSLLCVRKDLPVGSIAEFIAHARQRPGELNYASTGIGSPGHLFTELFKSMTGVAITHVPYRGSAPAQNDLVGGQVDLLIDNAAAIIGLVRAGTVKALGVTSPEPFRLAPDIAPVARTVSGYAAGSWFGVAVGAGVAENVRNAIEQATLAFTAERETQERLATMLSEPVTADRSTFVRFLDEERQRWSRLITDLDLKI